MCVFNKMLVKWIINYLAPEAKKRRCEIYELGITPLTFFYIVFLVKNEVISSHEGRQLIKESINNNTVLQA